jgi:nitrogen-specific signal transduction histidine kinase/DNA-binding NarL/FixJ family response regulator
MLMEEIEAHKRTDAALQKAKEVAEAANVAKTRYIVGLSHEIRTPLNSIFGYAQLMERGITGPADNAVRVIRRSAEHLANLIDGLLDISKIESGLLKLNRDKVQLVEFLDQIVDMFRLQAANRGIEFRYTCPPHLPKFVHTDQKRLRQILINLLSNAIKYTERGYAGLTVRYRSQVAEFEISDSGMGIPPEDLERVFQPFERGQSASVRSIPGTGLGLTITKLLTQIMGGEISARSSTDGGTTFTVKLLLSEATASSPVLITPARIHGYVGPRVTVVLIDDDPTHLDIVRTLLSALDFNVFVAPNGHAGIDLVSAVSPDLVMIDISMPDMSGWEVARTLRAREDMRHVRLMMVSANAHEFSSGGGEGSIHDAFVMKPIDVQLLLDSVATVLRLEWAFNPEPRGETMPVAASITALSRHHLDDLYQLGRIGHVRGIHAKLKEVEAEDPTTTNFTAQLRKLVTNFELKRYMTVLENYRK